MPDTRCSTRRDETPDTLPDTLPDGRRTVYCPPWVVFAISIGLTGCPAGAPGVGSSSGPPMPACRWVHVVAQVVATDAPNSKGAGGSTGGDSSKGSGAALERKAYDQLTATVPTLVRVVPERHWTTDVGHGERRQAARVSGTTPELIHLLQEAAHVKMLAGRFLSDGDVKFDAAVAVISSSLAETLFDVNNPIGKKLRVGDAELVIVGVIATPASTRISEIASDVYVPLPTLDKQLGKESTPRSPSLACLWLEVGSIEEVDATVEIVDATLQRTQPRAVVSVDRAW